MKFIYYFAFLFFSLGCGVKGDPIPPEQDAYIGRGRPTFKGAAEKIKLSPSAPTELDRSEADDRDEEEAKEAGSKK